METLLTIVRSLVYFADSASNEGCPNSRLHTVLTPKTSYHSRTLACWLDGSQNKTWSCTGILKKTLPSPFKTLPYSRSPITRHNLRKKLSEVAGTLCVLLKNWLVTWWKQQFCQKLSKAYGKNNYSYCFLWGFQWIFFFFFWSGSKRDFNFNG